MIASVRRLFTLAEDLAQTQEPRLWRGIAQGGLEAILGTVPYMCVYFILSDVLAENVSWNRVFMLTAVMFTALALQVAVGIRSMINIMVGAYHLFGAARTRLADHIRRLPMGWITSSRSGALVEAMTGMMNLLSEIWSHFIAYFSGGVTTPICIGLFLLFIDWRLGLVTLLTLPVAFATLLVAMRLQHRLIGEVLVTLSDANHAIVEYTRGIPVLRIFGRYGDGYKRLDQYLSKAKRDMIRAELLPAPLIGLFGATIDIGFTVLIFVGTWLWSKGRIDPHELLLFIVVSVKFFNPLYELGVSILLLRFGNQALESVQGILETPVLPESTKSEVPSGSDIAISNIAFTYEGAPNPALKGITAKIQKKQLTAIVGPSGSGKSTMVHLIARLWDVDSGSISIGGVDVRHMSSTELHKQVSMVFQDVVLFSGSVLDNLRIGKDDASQEAIMAAAKAAQAHDFIQALPEGYNTQIGEGGRRLSGGEQQRISIARALLKDAPILLLDEATASVDPTGEVHIQKAIDALVKDRTVVVIAHRLGTIRRAHKILVLDKGELVEQGTHEALIEQKGLYNQLWSQQGRAKGWHQKPSAGPESLSNPN